jgi:hypothetical protein
MREDDDNREVKRKAARILQHSRQGDTLPIAEDLLDFIQIEQ